MNGSGFSSLSPEVRGDLMPLTESIGDNILVSLSIPGKAVYNKTTVQCVAVESGGGEEESENVFLLYQGTETFKNGGALQRFPEVLQFFR